MIGMNHWAKEREPLPQSSSKRERQKRRHPVASCSSSSRTLMGHSHSLTQTCGVFAQVAAQVVFSCALFVSRQQRTSSLHIFTPNGSGTPSCWVSNPSMFGRGRTMADMGWKHASPRTSHRSPLASEWRTTPWYHRPRARPTPVQSRSCGSR